MRAKALPLLGLAALTLVHTSALLPVLGSELPTNPGDSAFITWLMSWDWHALTRDPWHIADANIFYPVQDALFFSELLLAPSIPFGIVVALTGQPILGFNLVLLGSLFLTAACAYLVAAWWTGDRVAGFAAGAVAAFSPVVLAQIDHLQLMTFWWASLALLAIDAYLARPRAALALGLVLCLWLQFLSGVYLSFYAAAAAALYGLARVFGGWRDDWRRLALHGALAIVVGAALFAPLARGYGRVAEDWEAQRSVLDVVPFSATPTAFLNPWELSLAYGESPLRKLGQQPLYNHEKRLFLGIVPLALAVVGLLGVRQSDRLGRTRAAAAAAVVLAGAVLALGPVLLVGDHATGLPLPYLALHRLLPGFQSMRVSARFIILANLGLALLVAFGLAALRRKGLRSPAWALLALLCLEQAHRPIPTGALADVFDARELDAVAEGRGALAWLPMLPITVPALPYVEAARMVQNQTLRPMINGYSGYFPPTFFELQRLVGEQPPERVVPVLRALGVGTVVVDTKNTPPEQARAWAELAERDPSVSAAPPVGSGRLRLYELRGRAPPQPPLEARVVDARLRAPTDVVTVELRNAARDPWVQPEPYGVKPVAAIWTAAGGARQAASGSAILPLVVLPGASQAFPVERLGRPAQPGRYRLRVVAGPVAAEGDVTVGGP